MNFLTLVWNTMVSAITEVLKFATALFLGVAITVWFLAEGPGTEQIIVPERVASVFDSACLQREDSFVEVTKQWLAEKGTATVDSAAEVEAETKSWYKETFLPAWARFKASVADKYNSVFGDEDEFIPGENSVLRKPTSVS